MMFLCISLTEKQEVLNNNKQNIFPILLVMVLTLNVILIIPLVYNTRCILKETIRRRALYRSI